MEPMLAAGGTEQSSRGSVTAAGPARPAQKGWGKGAVQAGPEAAGQ